EPLQIRARVQVMVTSGYQGGGSDFWNRSTAVCGGRLFAGACKRHVAAADRVPARQLNGTAGAGKDAVARGRAGAAGQAVRARRCGSVGSGGPGALTPGGFVL